MLATLILSNKGVIMVTISTVVKHILDSRVFLREVISRDIVSYNSLARYLKPEIEEDLGKEIKLSAVVMALRRQKENIKKGDQRPIFYYTIETIKPDLCYIALEESPTLINKLQNLYSIIDFKKGGVLNLIQGSYEVVIITNTKYKEHLLDVLHDEKITEVVDDLVSISLTYSKKFLFTPGAIYDISRFVAWENINIIDIILTPSEFSIIISKNDLMKCYRVLGRFAENSSKEK